VVGPATKKRYVDGSSLCAFEQKAVGSVFRVCKECRRNGVRRVAEVSDPFSRRAGTASSNRFGGSSMRATGAVVLNAGGMEEEGIVRCAYRVSS